MLSALTLSALMLSGSAFAADNVTNSKHNLSSSGATYGNTIYTTDGTDEVCVFCHTPHHGDKAGTGVALWNRAATAATFTMYSTSTIDMTISAQPQGVSLACLSCHDGTVAFDNLYNGPGAGDYNGNVWARGWTWTGSVNTMAGSASANVGMDLSNDHPISVTYDATLDTAFQSTSAVTGAGLALYGSGSDQVECGSCHNPHNSTYAPFLRINNQASSLCLACHIK